MSLNVWRVIGIGPDGRRMTVFVTADDRDVEGAIAAARTKGNLAKVETANIRTSPVPYPSPDTPLGAQTCGHCGGGFYGADCRSCYP